MFVFSDAARTIVLGTQAILAIENACLQGLPYFLPSILP